jgi:signal peptidase I
MLRRLPGRPEGEGRERNGAVESIVLVATALFFALAIQAYAVKPYRIPSPSMYPTLRVGDRVLVDRFAHRLGADPKVGEVTVFTPPQGAEDGRCGVAGEGPNYSGPRSHRPCSKPTPARADTAFVKRVVAGPGDSIEVRGGHVIRNGRAVREPYALACSQPACNLEPFTVPAGSWFMMGDNRGNSDDSRYWGPVPRSWIVGRAVVRYWPVDRAGGL